jgi:hypothetical protein
MREPIKFEFNTGRHYAADGQRIKCEYSWSEKIGSYVIRFDDVSRGIPGWIVYGGRADGEEGRRLMQAAVMAAYDHQAYAQGWLYE